MNQLLKLGEALASMARIMAQEEGIVTTGVTIPRNKFSRDDLEYLSSVMTKELPVTVGYYVKDEYVVVTFTRKSV
ncbi:hypothetical protein [Turicibacter sanguinis]|uniref:hypothetical protein n=1 Tax=Turicibacter sanguinis TaxID=154288 RepID=UPI0018A97765|nr:hypothetical protein [Turicibacter sanguinis]MDB8554071.1 hypothetical protein [Turicibacter sanguinis]